MIRPLLAAAALVARALFGRRGVRYVGGEIPPSKNGGDDVMFVLNPGVGEESR